MKHSFALFITIVLIALFSLLLVQIHFTQNITTSQKNKEYWHTQSSFHLKFFKSLILNSKSKICPNNLSLEIASFDIYAQIDCTKEPAVVDAFVETKSSDFSIRLHERFLKSFKQ